jgi:hypothetical protein
VQTQHSFYNIVDVGEISAVLAEFEQFDFLAREAALREVNSTMSGRAQGP